MICYINFKCGSIDLYKKRKQPTKYQYLGITPLSQQFSNLKITSIFIKNPYVLWQYIRLKFENTDHQLLDYRQSSGVSLFFLI